MNKTKLYNGGIGLVIGLAAIVFGIAMRRMKFQRARKSWQWASEAGRSNVALVTGASSGIGESFARLLAERKLDLILVARREDRLKELARELQDRHGISVEVLAADLTDAVYLERVAERVELLDNLELLVNNAGFGMNEKFAESDVDRQLEMIALHVTASMRLMRAALPGMIARRHGGIINVSSTAAFFTLPRNANYSASKAYLNVFTQSLQSELRGKGVRLQALCPGLTRTELHDHFENRRHRTMPWFMWMSADKVVAESLDALDRGQVVFVPGSLNKFIAFIGRTGLFNGIAQLVAR
ncbi:MAG: SDR family oxidoreductase [Chloroflexi bacterium]|nr:SDR family oxidoreductase [Chloroflexota bacterium]